MYTLIGFICGVILGIALMPVACVVSGGDVIKALSPEAKATANAVLKGCVIICTLIGAFIDVAIVYSQVNSKKTRQMAPKRPSLPEFCGCRNSRSEVRQTPRGPKVYMVCQTCGDVVDL